MDRRPYNNNHGNNSYSNFPGRKFSTPAPYIPRNESFQRDFLRPKNADESSISAESSLSKQSYNQSRPAYLPRGLEPRIRRESVSSISVTENLNQFNAILSPNYATVQDNGLIFSPGDNDAKFSPIGEEKQENKKRKLDDKEEKKYNIKLKKLVRTLDLSLVRSFIAWPSFSKTTIESRRRLSG